jgi:hypothetical protein
VAAFANERAAAIAQTVLFFRFIVFIVFIVFVVFKPVVRVRVPVLSTRGTSLSVSAYRLF